MKEDNFRQIGLETLCSIPMNVLSDLICGNIAIRAMDEGNNSLFAADTLWLQQSEVDALCVYVNLLVDKNGEYIPRRRLMSVLDVMRRYATVSTEGDVTTINEAVAVDNAFKDTGTKTERKYIRAGRHKFLWKAGKNGKLGVRRTSHLTMIQQFCDGVEARTRLRHTETLPLQYIGYAFNFAKRAKSHQSGDGSSFLMQLLRHMYEVLWPGIYRLMANPGFYACDAEEEKLGEILLTLLVYGPAATGMVMAIYQPGINNASADMRGWDASAMTAFWALCNDFREDMGFSKAAQDKELGLQEQPTEGNARQQDEELAETLRQGQEYYGILDERYGRGAWNRIIQRRRDTAARIKQLRKDGGPDILPLVNAHAQREADDAKLMELQWPVWWKWVMHGHA